MHANRKDMAGLDEWNVCQPICHVSVFCNLQPSFRCGHICSAYLGHLAFTTGFEPQTRHLDYLSNRSCVSRGHLMITLPKGH